MFGSVSYLGWTLLVYTLSQSPQDWTANTAMG